MTADPGIANGSWSEIFRNGLGLYSALVIGGIAMNATQMLVIAIIMPTIVRDIGGASFYTWAAMLYTIGSIVGGASTEAGEPQGGRARRAIGRRTARPRRTATGHRPPRPTRRSHSRRACSTSATVRQIRSRTCLSVGRLGCRSDRLAMGLEILARRLEVVEGRFRLDEL
jgi:hypothetical protein